MIAAGGELNEPAFFHPLDAYIILLEQAHLNDLHASLLHLLGINHEKLTYRFQGRDFRLTDVAGKLIKPVLS